MKKKLATLCVFVFMCLCIFTGCNLWRSDSYANLDAIVATNGDIKITRENLITAYNSSGYYYDQYYGYTRKEAIERTIDSLISREYLLRYIENLAKNDARYELNKAEKYSVIQETWNYIDTSITSIVEQVRSELDLTKEDLSTEDESSSNNGSGSTSDYKAKEEYSAKFELGTYIVQEENEDGTTTQKEKNRVVKLPNYNTDYVPETLPSIYDYQINLKSSSEDYKRIVWNRYIKALKRNQESYKYADMGDNAVFRREIDKTYKTNLENAKLKKYENLYSQNFGLDYDKTTGEYFLNNKTLQDIIDKYKTTYNSNKELYNLSSANSNIVSEDDVKNTFYKLLTTTSSREDYLYYGNPTTDETLMTCVHILIKLSEEQTTKMAEWDENPIGKEPYNDEITVAENEKRIIKAPENTFGYYRTYDEEGKATESKDGTSVIEIYNEILEEINTKVTANRGSQEYVEQVVKIFDKYIYTYNQDTGIVNAKFDYIVGTKTSSMVESFTEVVRKLYNDGKIDATYDLSMDADYNDDVTLYFPNGVGFAGAISAPFLEEASNYSGYHIVLYTGTLRNIEADTLTLDNVFERLNSSKTSIAYGQTIFEFIYDKIAKETYNTYQTNLVNSIMKNETKLNSSNYSDLI